MDMFEKLRQAVYNANATRRNLVRKKRSETSSSQNLLGDVAQTEAPSMATNSAAAESHESQGQLQEDFHQWIANGNDDKAQYTKGPAKMIAVSDARNEWPALLISFKLSRQLQDQLLAEREIDLMRVYVSDEQDRLQNLLNLIDAPIRECEYTLENGLTMYENETIDDACANLEIWKPKQEAFEAKLRALEGHGLELEGRLTNLREEANATLDDIFTKAGILDTGSANDASKGHREWAVTHPSMQHHYFKGPAKLIQVLEEGKHMPALLLSFELATELRKCLVSQREWTSFINACDDELARIANDMEEMQAALGGKEKELREFECAFRLANDDALEAHDKAVEQLNQEREDIQESIELLEERKDALQEQYKEMWFDHDMMQDHAERLLDDAFSERGLLPARDETSAMEAIRAIWDRPGDDEGIYFGEVLRRLGIRENPDWNEHQRKIAVDLALKRLATLQAQHNFDMQPDYQGQFQEYLETQVGRSDADFEEEFGPIYLKKSMETSQAYTKAIAEYEAAKETARNVGVNSSVASVYSDRNMGSDSDDSHLFLPLSDAKRKRIMEWMQKVADPVPENNFFAKKRCYHHLWDTFCVFLGSNKRWKRTHGSNLKNDDGVGGRSPSEELDLDSVDAPFGSVSVIAHDEYRSKIDDWAQKVRDGKR